MDLDLYKKIIRKKEYSQLPKTDVELAFSKFDSDKYLDEEKVKLTRALLMKSFIAFSSKKLFSLKERSPEWVLKKHLSTRERLSYYGELYFGLIKKEEVIIDLGAGVNGFSYPYLDKALKYVGVEAVGQFVDSMNLYFEKNKLNALAIHESLFNLDKIKKIIKKEKGKKIVFLFKVLDSLEMLEKDYSKRLLKEIVPLADKVIVSFATRSMLKKEKFKVTRKWLVEFIERNFKILDDFELGNERYISFK